MLLLAFALYLRNPILLIFGRAFTGLLAGSIGLAQAAIIDISPEKQKTVNLSLISLASSLGFTTGAMDWRGSGRQVSLLLFRIFGTFSFFGDLGICQWFSFNQMLH